VFGALHDSSIENLLGSASLSIEAVSQTVRDKARNFGALRGFEVRPKPDGKRFEMGL
jgi:hypothetical protein